MNSKKHRGPVLTDAKIAAIAARVAANEKPEAISEAEEVGLTKVYEVRRWMRRLGVMPKRGEAA